MNKVRCNDIEICYEAQGKGFPLVMIMGLGASLDWWDQKLIEGTCRNYQTVIFDNRGAGRTDAPSIDYSIKMFADDTAELMNQLMITRARILGYSMGGMIAQEFALSYPGRVEKLALCSTNCGTSRSFLAAPEVQMKLFGAPTKTLEDRVKDVISIIFTPDFIESNPGYIKQMTERIMKAPITPEAYTRQFNALRTWDSYSRLPEITARTLVMHGKKDILIPPENAEIVADRIPKAKLVYVEKSGHALFQETGSVNTLLEFLALS